MHKIQKNAFTRHEKYGKIIPSYMKGVLLVKDYKKQMFTTSFVIATLLCSGCKSVANDLSPFQIDDENTNVNTYKIFQPITIKSIEETSDITSSDVKDVMEFVPEIKIGVIKDSQTSVNDTLISKLTEELAGQSSNIMVEMITPAANNTNSYLNSVNDLILKGVQIILIPNQTYEKELEPMIQNYPDIVFVTLDCFTNSSNVLGLKFRDESAAYLAGVIAASQTLTNKIAYIGYQENQSIDAIYIEGFKAGAKALNEEIVITEKYLTKDVSKTEFSESVKRLYDENNDIIFESIGNRQQEIISVAKEYTQNVRPVWVINSTLHLSDQNQHLQGEPVVLSSTVKNIDVAICNVLNSFLSGELVLGTQIILGLENSGVDVTLTSQSLSQTTIELVQLYKEKIITGEVIVPTPVGTNK